MLKKAAQEHLLIAGMHQNSQGSFELQQAMKVFGLYPRHGLRDSGEFGQDCRGLIGCWGKRMVSHA
jgi:hypothetical protein